jgi:UDP-2,3-diacylglucosamine hydrolase
MAPEPRLGIIAGGGGLPRLIAAARQAAARPFFIAAISGACEPATVEGAEHAWIDMAAVGKLVAALRAKECREVVFAGPVPRPDFTRLRPDRQGLALLPKVIAAAVRGDDALFRTLVEYLEAQGFSVVGADDLLGELLAPAGPLGSIAPGADDLADIARGIAEARALGASDKGQAVVVRGGAVLGVETIDGTDALLARCARSKGAKPGGVLVKIAKPGQERRVDLPTIGAATVAGAAAAGLAGIAVEAGGVLVIDRAAMRQAADRAGLFVVGVAG